MNCKDVENRINDYFSLESSKETKEKFNQHLSECVECKAIIQKIDNDLKEIQGVEVKPFLYTRLMQKMQNQDVDVFNFFPSISLIPRMVITVMIIVFSLFLGIKSGDFISTTDNTDEDLIAMEYYWDDLDTHTIENFWLEEEE